MADETPFDERKHDIVAVDRKTGEHIHVPLPALAAGVERYDDDREMLPRLAELERRIAEMMMPAATPVVQQDVSQPAEQPNDLPQFLRREIEASGVDMPPPAPAPFDDRVSDAFVETDRRIDVLEHRLDVIEKIVAALNDMPPIEPDRAAKEDVEKLTAWLSRIDEAAAKALALAEHLSRPPPPPITPDPPPPTLDQLRAAGHARVKAAAVARRAKITGMSDDERDKRRRIAEVALNARAGNPMWISKLEPLAQAVGKKWGDLAQHLVSQSDRAYSLAVETEVIEIEASQDLEHAVAGDIDAIVERHVARIEGLTT